MSSNTITAEMDALVAKYELQRTVDESAKTLLGGLSSKVRQFAGEIVANNAANTTAKASLIAMADKIDADTTSMAEAISAHTVAENETP